MGALQMQRFRDGIKIGVSNRSLYTRNVTDGSSCPSIRADDSTFTPELIARDAQEWRKSCGVIFCTLARFTAPANHPSSDFGRGR